ncbi:MAG: hypothetical protein EA415_07600 [Sphaerobacteraceae bacterium]|nr:MAG: hypothetical protein EA415_07600 [Sphaerobacteraceae bacterium]
MSAQSSRICAIRLPGTSRARFADAGEVAVSLGDWVVIDIGAGEESGQIVVAPDQWTTAIEMEDVPRIIRRLDDAEFDALAQTIELTRSLINPAADMLRTHSPGTRLAGLRLTLDRSTAIVAYLGPEPENAAVLDDALSRAIDRPVVLEQDLPGDPDRAMLGGGIGRPSREDAETFQELLQRRIDVIRDPESFAPHGMPRLGTQVFCDDGDGVLVAVDVRRWTATVRLADGTEITAPVDSLRQP